MNDMIKIPRAEYDRLVAAAEDAADAQTIERFKAKLASGEEELLPSDMVDKMLEGESPLKVWREYRGLTQNRLAQESGVNRVQINNIERLGKTGSVATIQKLAAALNVDMDDLVA